MKKLKFWEKTILKKIKFVTKWVNCEMRKFVKKKIAEKNQKNCLKTNFWEKWGKMKTWENFVKKWGTLKMRKTVEMRKFVKNKKICENKINKKNWKNMKIYERE